MKSYDINPTYKNLFETFVKDTLERNKDIFIFTDMLNTIEDCCSIALDGNWGSGKTFFVRQAKLFLDANNQFLKNMDDNDKLAIISKWTARNKNKELNYKSQVSIYYDAWENDNDQDPMLSLVYNIIKNIDMDYEISVNKGLLNNASNILEFFTGKNWSALIEGFRGEDPLTEINKSKSIEKDISQFLDSVLEERGDRLIIFIDELDRCKPSYAVRLLERIKHYFSNDRITFVFSINTNELQHTIKRYYGESFDACRYLDRFFDLRVSLPPINQNSFYNYIGFNNTRYLYDKVCHAFIKKYNFSLRETSKYLRLAKVAAYLPTHDNGHQYSFVFPEGKAIQFCLLYIIPIMLGLKIADIQRYDNFISGKDPSILYEFSDAEYTLFNQLLNRDETYHPCDQSTNVVSINDKLKQVYTALFITDYSGAIYKTNIGECEFNAHSKEVLIRTASLLSNYALFDYD